MATAKMRGLYVRIQMWNGGYKQACAVTTFKSLVGNCIIGVTEGFRYRMKMVHAHFPITAIIAKDKKQVEIKNFLGGKKSHLIKMQEVAPSCLTQPRTSRTSSSSRVSTTPLSPFAALKSPVSATSSKRMSVNSWTVSSSPPRSSSTQKTRESISFMLDLGFATNE